VDGQFDVLVIENKGVNSYYKTIKGTASSGAFYRQ
jgi:hypothetical protein